MPWNDTRPWIKDPATRFSSPPDPAILARLHDAHCHPSDDDEFVPETLRRLKTGILCAMSSSLANQEKTREVYKADPDKVVPFFGLHPWFCHPISFEPPDAVPAKADHYRSLFPDLSDSSAARPSLSSVLDSFPDPVSMSTYLSDLEANLSAHPTSHVGEIGLDRAFRIPTPPHIAADKRNPKHTDLATPLSHQLRIVEAQVDLAIRLGKNISLHSVRAPQETVDMLRRFKEVKGEGWQRIHVCLHSFGGSAESAKQIQKAHPNVFFSFATIISGRSPHFHKLLQAIEPDRLLVESDFSDTREIDNQIWEVFQEILTALSWTPEEAVSRLGANWERFVSPIDERPKPKLSNREKKRERKRVDLYVSDEEEA
ncbi:Cut9-interacting protein scn1 [Rhodotorula toruloides]|nr:Cut9-interacting protein scn1 [Rhodotorula toruloides]